MQTLSLIWGILAVVGMMVGFFPCFGSLNWINIPFAAIGLIISIIAYSKASPQEGRGSSIAGIVCCAIAAILGFLRLSAGGGVL